MRYAGFYINLDRNPDRREQIEAELAAHKLISFYSRFKAIDGNALRFPNPTQREGLMGCFSSHYRLFEENLHSDAPLHIIEDDVIFSPQTAPVIDWVIEQNILSQYDIIYTDVAMPLLNDVFAAYKKFYNKTVTYNEDGTVAKASFSVVDLRNVIFASTSSYLVNPKSLPKLSDLYAKELNGGTMTPVDIFVRQKCHNGEIRVGCILPFVTSVRLDLTPKTSIAPTGDLVSVLAATIARYTFFVGCDWTLCRQYLETYLKLPGKTTPQDEILRHLLAFSLTDAFDPSPKTVSA